MMATRAIKIVGLDLAKPEFPVVAYNEDFKEVKRRTLRRSQILDFFSRLPPCQVGLELRLGAHYWGRQLNSLGHKVKLVPSRCLEEQMDDEKRSFFSEARAIAIKLTDSNSFDVAIKSIEQQEVQAIRQMHSQCLKDRTYLCNLTWALLTDCGISLPKGVGALRRHLPEILEDPDNGLSSQFRRVLSHRYEQLVELDGHLAFFDNELFAFTLTDRDVRELSAAVQVADGRSFLNNPSLKDSCVRSSL